MLHVGQDFRLEAGANFLQRIDEPGHFIGSDLPVQAKSIQPGHLAPHPRKRIQRHRIAGDRTSAFGWWVNAI